MLKHEFVVLAMDQSSWANFCMPTYLHIHINVGRIYNNSFFASPIEIKKLCKFITILINKDNNVWTSQISVDMILPIQHSKCLPELPNNLL